MLYDFPFTLSDVLTLLGIKHNTSKDSSLTECPFCRRPNKHLSVTLSKGCVKCFKCGYGDGMIGFYREVTGLSSNKEAYKNILKELNLGGSYTNYNVSRSSSNRASTKPTMAYEETEEKFAPIEHRDKVYRVFLSYFTLSDKHKQDLLNRGLSEADIIANGYKTTLPQEKVNAIVDKISKIYDLAGVAGFYKENGRWLFVKLNKGILIPVRTLGNLIQGFQLRIDEDARKIIKTYDLSTTTFEEHRNNADKLTGYDIFKIDGDKKEFVGKVKSVEIKNNKLIAVSEIEKYIWISSANKECGTKAKTYIHYAGLYVKQNDKIRPYIKDGRVVITEGPLKGDTFFSLTQIPILCVPGVHNIVPLEATLEKLCLLSPIKEVYLGYDMDYKTNPNVDGAMKKTIAMLNSLAKRYSFTVSRLEWDEQYKGIDDYYFYLKKEKKNN